MFGFGKKKINMNWAELVFATPIQHPERITEEMLRQATERQVVRRCEIITESIEIIRNTKYEDTRQGRIDLCQKHIDYLRQLAMIQQCETAISSIGDSTSGSGITWEHLYKRYDQWSTSTLVKRLSMLENYGTADELLEVADAACDEKAACRLIIWTELQGGSRKDGCRYKRDCRENSRCK